MPTWLNTTKVQYPELAKPCELLIYCPYGQLVEEFPFSGNELKCPIYGHDCPVHYHAEFTFFESARKVLGLKKRG